MKNIEKLEQSLTYEFKDKNLLSINEWLEGWIKKDFKG
ncbi:TPA: ribonuclease HI, partial [Campylobacter jejuni]|nr:ribonuclease HI [Campylobacter jejuni]